MPRRRPAPSEDEGAAWKDYRQAQQARRAIRLPVRTQEILDLRGKNFDVLELTAYQFRIDNRLDLFPTHRRYHDVKLNRRGNYKRALDVAIRILRGPA